jgi:YHYH protein
MNKFRSNGITTDKLAVLAVLVALGLSACGDGGNTAASATTPAATATPAAGATTTGTGTTNGTTTSSTSTAGVACNYSYSALNSSASVSATSTSAWTCSATARALAANGLPEHEVGTFPNPGNPNTISAQTVSASYTLTPTLTTTATELGGPRGATGYILNGVKIDASTAGSCNDAGTSCSLIGNTGSWSIEALGQTSFNFGTDSNNAHVQPDGAYHYHGMPEGFITKQGGGNTKMTLIGWAADGYPIYARYGYTVAASASSTLKAVTGSYQKVTTVSATRPSTSTYPLGTFRQDYQYVAGSGDLDECNGRTGVTPEFPNGIYHYYATDTYPFLQRCVKGAVVSGAGRPPPPP